MITFAFWLWFAVTVLTVIGVVFDLRFSWRLFFWYMLAYALGTGFGFALGGGVTH